MPSREWASAEYSRIYWTIVTDPKFAEVFYDDRRWAAYTRLLMAAEAAYPSPAPLPRWLAEDVQEDLEARRIIEVIHNGYRIVGLRTEREGRLSGRRIGGVARVADAQRDDHGRFVAGTVAGTVAGHRAGDRTVSGATVAGTGAGDGVSADAGADAGDAGDAGDLLDTGLLDASKPASTRTSTSIERDEVLTPLPPSRGGQGSRANGTGPRARAEAAARVAEIEETARRWRRGQRDLAYHRGTITTEQLAEMNDRDASLDEIVDMAEHQAAIALEVAASL